MSREEACPTCGKQTHYNYEIVCQRQDDIHRKRLFECECGQKWGMRSIDNGRPDWKRA